MRCNDCGDEFPADDLMFSCITCDERESDYRPFCLNCAERGLRTPGELSCPGCGKDDLEIVSNDEQ